MIELKAVTDSERAKILCPNCGVPILDVGEHEEVIKDHFGKWTREEHFLPVGDYVVGRDMGVSWVSVLMVGSRECCGKDYVFARVAMVKGDLDWDDSVPYLFEKDAVEGRTNFLASRGKRAWLVGEYESDIGPVFEHLIGPVAWPDRSWMEENGKIPDGGRDDPKAPWRYATRMVLSLWDDLREVCLRENPALSGNG